MLSCIYIGVCSFFVGTYLIMEKNRFITVVLLGLCLFTFIIWYEGQYTAPVSTESYSKVVAITFDDGPNWSTTTALLDGLRERGVRATFFIVGERIKGNEDLILRMKEEGHLIGNHSYSHTDLTKASEEQFMNEINETNRLIEEITGEPVKFIRPPCGYWNDELADKVDMTAVLWNVDPLDWCTDDVGVVVGRVMDDVEDGDIILFHDIYGSSVTAALEVIDQLADRGFVFVTVEELLDI